MMRQSKTCTELSRSIENPEPVLSTAEGSKIENYRKSKIVGDSAERVGQSRQSDQIKAGMRPSAIANRTLSLFWESKNSGATSHSRLAKLRDDTASMGRTEILSS